MMVAMDNCFVFPHHQPSPNWDPPSFVVGVAHQDFHGLLTPPLPAPHLTPNSTFTLHAVMDEPLPSPSASTGYLQDAVAGWRPDQCKRRRSIGEHSSNCDSTMVAEELQELFQGFGNSNWCGDVTENLGLDEPWSSLAPLRSSITQENTAPPQPSPPSSTIKIKEMEVVEQHKKRRKKKKKATRVVYPFTLVKSGGIDGDVTLADINERILRRPSRPVRHPVGEFACGPCVSSTSGPGLSGKDVVGLTRIYTHNGRGTVTIIRTRG